MFYQQSSKILEIIKNSNNILINIHRNPDLDSVGSATAMYQVFTKMGKKVTLICPHEIPEDFKFLKGAKEIQTIDFKEWAGKPSPYDLFLILDSGSYDIVTGSKEIKLPDIKKIIIDHHRTNNWEGYLIRLLDPQSSATCEIIYQMFLDWGIEIDSDIATSLFSGIASDTVFFKYSTNSKSTFKIASELLELGAENDKLVAQVFDNLDFNLVKMMGECLRKMEKGNSLAGKYIYSIVDNKTFVKYGEQKGAREIVANLFARSVKGFDFGIILVEYEKDKFAMSFRSKKNTDVSVIAKKLGGGGHKNAAGATIYGSIDQVIRKIKEIS
ncbi:MAG: bifunctional oligoribonuclease/PAP phosphatase NrnA [Patescibacteria group bacterium]